MPPRKYKCRLTHTVEVVGTSEEQWWAQLNYLVRVLIARLLMLKDLYVLLPKLQKDAVLFFTRYTVSTEYRRQTLKTEDRDKHHLPPDTDDNNDDDDDNNDWRSLNH